MEPESGEVAALRPDMTPQIARLIATRLRDRPPPYRIAYEWNRAARRMAAAPASTGRSRRRASSWRAWRVPRATSSFSHSRSTRFAPRACRAFTIDVADAGIVRALLAGRSAEDQARLSEGLARKDEAAVDDRLLRKLLALQGGREAIVEGTRLLEGTPAQPAVARLLALFDGAAAHGLGPRLSADLGEVRGFAYYTGPIFHAYAPGTGDALASGGRYDELLVRFGSPMPAAGFAIDLDRTGEALHAAGVARPPVDRVVVFGAGAQGRAAQRRAAGTPATTAAGAASAIAWARAWGFTRVLDAASGASIAASETDAASERGVP